MSTEIVMPRLSDTMETGTIAKWLKNEGDQVQRGDILAEIETDKSNMELESYADGILARISVPAGKSAGVGEPIGVIAANEDEAKKLANPPSEPPAKAGNSLTAEAKPAQTDQPPPDQMPPGSAPQVGGFEPDERIKASPLARRMAQEHGINLMDVAGTGPGGRITKEDIQSFLKQAQPIGQPPQVEAETRPTSQPAAPSQIHAQQPRIEPSAGRGGQPVEMTRMQQTIARRMTEARFSAPEFVLTAEFDMTEARALLATFKATEGAPKIGPNDLLIKAVAHALREHPEVNAGWENGNVVQYQHINVGTAVAIPGGLVVPVIHDADKKSLGQVARESKELIEKARNGKLAPSEYENGTFTISNLGMYGIEQFTPIINIPEACIMGVGAITPQPVVLDGQVVVRDRMHVSLACDHRVINGAQGAEFLRTLRRYLENPMLIVL